MRDADLTLSAFNAERSINKIDAELTRRGEYLNASALSEPDTGSDLAAISCRSTGSRSASNHGFFLIQALLRQEGCGSGRIVGRALAAMISRQAATVSVRVGRAMSPRCQAWA